MKEGVLLLDKIPSGSLTDQDIYLIPSSHRHMIRQF